MTINVPSIEEVSTLTTGELVGRLKTLRTDFKEKATTLATEIDGFSSIIEEVKNSSPPTFDVEIVVRSSDKKRKASRTLETVPYGKLAGALNGAVREIIMDPLVQRPGQRVREVQHERKERQKALRLLYGRFQTAETRIARALEKSRELDRREADKMTNVAKHRSSSGQAPPRSAKGQVAAMLAGDVEGGAA